MLDALSLTFAPVIPSWLLLAAAVLSLALLLLGLFSRASGLLPRSLVLAILLLALANPAAVHEDREARDDVALVVADRSASQSRIAPRPEQTDRALSRLREQLDGLDNTRVQVLESRGEGSGSAAGTQLFQDISDSLSDIGRDRVSAIFVLSEGRIHDTPETLQNLGVDVPIHHLKTGRENERDRQITVEEMPAFALVDQSERLRFRVEDLGGVQGNGQAEVTLFLNGEPVEQLQVPVGETRELPFTLERRGASILELEVAAAPEELTELNNRVATTVNGVRDRLRVLLVSGEPHPGSRAWRNILKSDPSVDLVHFTILRPPEKQDGTPIDELSLIAFPTRELFEVKLPEFDLVVFDRYQRRGVLPAAYYNNIAAYVENGGALLDVSGPDYVSPMSLWRTGLRRVLPAAPTGEIFEQPYRPDLTETGERHPVTSSLLDQVPRDETGQPAWGEWFRLIDSDPGAADVLMSGASDRPLLLLSRQEQGRVAQLSSDQIWLWGRGYDGGGPQRELVRRIAHWLMKEPDLEEEDLLAETREDRLVITRRTLDDDTDPVEVTLPDGQTRSLSLEQRAPGRFEASLPIDQQGLYRVEQEDLLALAALGAINAKEFEDPRATAEILDPLREESGGGLAELHAEAVPALRKVAQGRDRHGAGWMGVLDRQSYRVTGVERTPLLPGLLLLLLILGGLMAAWYREGR
ncbi:membrane protein [Fodinicurvata fenggangensis]|uniref:membrane protein n=1 Tax=Fodinicurvata fenggangensis TaxID=1121830 RepID=UPI00047D3DC4|nr:membrane protein [Fodinicurvata fenggangensis]